MAVDAELEQLMKKTYEKRHEWMMTREEASRFYSRDVPAMGEKPTLLRRCREGMIRTVHVVTEKRDLEVIPPVVERTKSCLGHRVMAKKHAHECDDNKEKKKRLMEDHNPMTHPEIIRCSPWPFVLKHHEWSSSTEDDWDSRPNHHEHFAVEYFHRDNEAGCCWGWQEKVIRPQEIKVRWISSDEAPDPSWKLIAIQEQENVRELYYVSEEKMTECAPFQENGALLVKTECIEQPMPPTIIQNVRLEQETGSQTARKKVCLGHTEKKKKHKHNKKIKKHWYEKDFHPKKKKSIKRRTYGYDILDYQNDEWDAIDYEHVDDFEGCSYPWQGEGLATEWHVVISEEKRPTPSPCILWASTYDLAQIVLPEQKSDFFHVMSRVALMTEIAASGGEGGDAFLPGEVEQGVSQGERERCHYVGVQEDRTVFCCFASSISRCAQEQIRERLHISWGTAANPNCRGITLDELERIDLEQIDLTEEEERVAFDLDKVGEQLRHNLKNSMKKRLEG
jgi:hypothetical protein